MSADSARAVVFAFAIAMILFGAVAVTALVLFHRYGRNADSVRHTEEVLTKLSEGLGELKDAETGQRGFLLTANEQFLEPYARSVSVVHARFDELAKLTADNPTQQHRLAELRPLIDDKLAFVAETIVLFQRGDRAGAIERVRSRRGKLLMDDIRRRVADMEREERALLAQRMKHTESVSWLTNIFIIVGNGLAFALLAGGTVLLGREANRRVSVERELELERKREALAARENEQHRRMQSVLDEMPVGVSLVDRDGRVTFSNARMRSLFGDGQPDYVRLDGTPYPPGERPIERALRRKETVTGEEVQGRRRGGATCTIITSATPLLDDAGDVVAVVSTFDDFSEVKRGEEERRRAERFRDLFIGVLGHDMRNPLSVITAGAASLSRRNPDAAQAKVLMRMTSSADRMARMIDQLLDMAHARLGRGLPIDRGPADAGEIARRVIERLEVTYPERSLELSASGDLDGEWDAARLAQVLTYLAVNALEHGRANAPVHVTAHGADGAITYEVHNEGPKIPDDQLPLMFDPFLRAAERRRMKSTGLGLGLYLSLQIARAHGGDVRVESSVEAGTTFRVVLPRRHAA